VSARPGKIKPKKHAPPKGWTFSEAPTVMIFLAVPGEPTVFEPLPLFPAAKTIVISWFPSDSESASRTRNWLFA
jgi:hypothetical protein